MSKEQQSVTKKEYERAFNELATFLLAQYKKKKQADLTSEPNEEAIIPSNHNR